MVEQVLEQAEVEVVVQVPEPVQEAEVVEQELVVEELEPEERDGVVVEEAVDNPLPL